MRVKSAIVKVIIVLFSIIVQCQNPPASSSTLIGRNSAHNSWHSFRKIQAISQKIHTGITSQKYRCVTFCAAKLINYSQSPPFSTTFSPYKTIQQHKFFVYFLSVSIYFSVGPHSIPNDVCVPQFSSPPSSSR